MDDHLQTPITASELADVLQMVVIDLMHTLAPQTGDEKLETLANHLLDTVNALPTPGPRKAALTALAERLIQGEYGARS